MLPGLRVTPAVTGGASWGHAACLNFQVTYEPQGLVTDLETESQVGTGPEENQQHLR